MIERTYSLPFPLPNPLPLPPHFYLLFIPPQKCGQFLQALYCSVQLTLCKLITKDLMDLVDNDEPRIQYNHKGFLQTSSASTPTLKIQLPGMSLLDSPQVVPPTPPIKPLSLTLKLAFHSSLTLAKLSSPSLTILEGHTPTKA
ncbi:hypothetical protein EMCRGX_G019290 [Ephydatia muelleri]